MLAAFPRRGHTAAVFMVYLNPQRGRSRVIHANTIIPLSNKEHMEVEYALAFQAHFLRFIHGLMVPFKHTHTHTQGHTVDASTCHFHK